MFDFVHPTTKLDYLEWAFTIDPIYDNFLISHDPQLMNARMFCTNNNIHMAIKFDLVLVPGP